jgi:hypothetical protein
LAWAFVAEPFIPGFCFGCFYGKGEAKAVVVFELGKWRMRVK